MLPLLLLNLSASNVTAHDIIVPSTGNDTTPHQNKQKMYCEMYSIGSDRIAYREISFDPHQTYKQPSLIFRSYFKHTGGVR